MALVLADRVQQTGTANTTVSFTLSGSVTGFQSFAVVGNTNTTYYSALDSVGNWEVGLGTYSTTGPTLTRTTILSSSNSGSAVTFSGTVNVILTYPSSKSVNQDASGNVGIGTTSPVSSMQLVRSSDPQFVITDDGSSSFSLGTTTGLSIVGTDAAALTFKTGVSTGSLFSTGNERMRITNAGFVGIGTSSPGSPLVVNTSNAGGLVYFANTATGDSRALEIANTNASGLPNGLLYMSNTNDANNTTYNFIQCVGGSTTRFIVYGNGSVSTTGSITSSTSGNIALSFGGQIATGFYSDATNVAIRSASGSSNIYMQNASGVTTFGYFSSGGWNGAVVGNVTGNVSGSSGSCTGNAVTATTATLANGVNQYPNRTDGAWYQAVWSNAAGGDKNIYSTNNVTIYSASYGAIGFYGTTWTIGGNASWGLGSNTGLITSGSMAAPSYYDSNNTAYYVDPNSTSNMYFIINNSPGISFQGYAAWAGVGSNQIGFGWSSPNVSVGVDNAVSGNFVSLSDRRLKTDIVNFGEATDLLNRVRVVEYTPLDFDGTSTNKRCTGVIADELLEIIPEAVVGETNGTNTDGTPRYQSVTYAALTPFLTKGFQEHDLIIKAQQAQIEQMQAQIDALIAKVGL